MMHDDLSDADDAAPGGPATLANLLGHYVLGVDGAPVRVDDWRIWAEWLQTAERHVALSLVGAVDVSTVFLGLDHSHGAGAPILFESMVFGGVHDEDQERYATRAEALVGHAALTEQVLRTGPRGTGTRREFYRPSGGPRWRLVGRCVRPTHWRAHVRDTLADVGTGPVTLYTTDRRRARKWARRTGRPFSVLHGYPTRWYRVR